MNRIIRLEVFCKKGALKNFTKSTENTSARASFLIKVDNVFLYKRNTAA